MYMFNSVAEFIEYCKLMNNIEDLIAAINNHMFVTFKHMNNAICLANAITAECIVDKLRFSDESIVCFFVELA